MTVPNRPYRRSPAADHILAVNRAIEQMRNHLADPVHLSDLAKVVSFSPFHFHRLFQELTSMTPARFFAAMRMAQARRLLLHSRLTVTAVSTMVGYTSTGTFTTQFSRLVGASPARFRQLARRLAGHTAGSLTAHLAGGGAGHPVGTSGVSVVGSAAGQLTANLIAATENAPARPALVISVPAAGPEQPAVVLLRPLDHSANPSVWPVGLGAAPLALRTQPGSYEARVLVVNPGATLTEALVDDAPGSFLTASARLQVPGDGPPRRLEVAVRPPRPTDPPTLSVAPLHLMAELIQGRRHRLARPPSHRTGHPATYSAAS